MRATGHSLPGGAETPQVAAFYADELAKRQWRLVERLDGPVLNFRRGAAFVSVNLESRRVGEFEIAVDHGGEPRLVAEVVPELQVPRAGRPHSQDGASPPSGADLQVLEPQGQSMTP